MKQSKVFIPTLREIPTDADVLSHQMLLRAGYIRSITAGVYSYLPLAQKVLNKINNIVRQEMEKINALEMMAPILLPAELWEESDRYESYGPDLFKLQNRHKHNMILGPTHEETMTKLIGNDIKSYKKLPLIVYQIQTKLRDEKRPRFGLLRGREFIMQDAYSFSLDKNDLNEIYLNVEKAYINIFNKIGITYRIIVADSGAMGGSQSKEFSAISSVGEDTVVYSENSEYAANIEMAKDLYITNKSHAVLKKLEKIETPNSKTIQELSDFLNKDKKEIIKSILLIDNNEDPVLVLVRSDYEVNETKIKNVLSINDIRLANDLEIEKYLNTSAGYVGPIDINIKIIADELVNDMINSVVGANENGYHFINVNPNRDFNIDIIEDIRTVNENSLAIDGSGKLKFAKGIEIGHIFKLGTRYSHKMNAQVLNKEGKPQDIEMGSYGIGISRVLATIAEQNSDEKGLIWPIEIAPWDVHLIPIKYSNETQRELTDNIYKQLNNNNFKVLLDDRNERAGVKFTDSDLIGLPVRVTVGKRASDNIVEVKLRKSDETIEVLADNLSNILHILLYNNENNKNIN